MYKVNKLIGIIDGINSDEVINSQEAIKLKYWVDRNRNLAYEYRHMQLIKLLDEILEDNVITDAERTKLISYCNSLKDIPSDTTAKIYELNGIIEGIVCDEKVNEIEVYRLKNWMDKHNVIIKENKELNKLERIIDDIINDGVVTQEEQKQLLGYLTEHILNSRLDVKLQYLIERVKNRENIGVDLIDLLDNYDGMDIIHHKAERQLKSALNSYTGISVENQEIVFISLVLIAMLNYDGNFYNSVRETYKALYDTYSAQRIEGLIRTIIARFRNDTDNKKSRKINTVLANTIVPSHYLKPFFEFIYDIYKLNFEYELGNNMYEDFKFVYEGLKENMVSEGDDIQVNVTKKSYKLIQSTKQLIVNGIGINAVINLSVIVVKLIDKKIWGKDIKIFNPYLKQGFEGWISTLEDDHKSVCNKSKSSFRSYWEPRYVLEGNKVYLDIPVHRIKSSYDYSDIKLIVKNGEEIIHLDDTPVVKEIIGGCQVKIDKKYIEKPFGKIRYQVFAGDDLVYDSHEKLYREFLVFNDLGNEIFNNTNYSGTAIVCVDNVPDKRFKLFYKGDTYCLFSINVSIGEAYIIGSTIFNFSAFIKPGVVGTLLQNHNILDINTGIAMDVYKQMKYLVYECEASITKFEILIDGIRHKLDDFTYTQSCREGVNKYTIVMNILDNGIHKVEVYSLCSGGKKNRLLSETFAIDDLLDVETIKIDRNHYMISIASSLFEGRKIKEFTPNEFDVNWLTFIINEKSYIYYIPYDIDVYRIEGSCWKAFNEDLWIGDISPSSMLNVYGNRFDEIQIYSSDGNLLEDSIKLTSPKVYQSVSLGFLISYKPIYDYVVIVFLKDGRRKQSIFCYNKCVLNNEQTEFLYDPVKKDLIVSPKYYGKGSIYFTVVDSNDNEVYKSAYVDSEDLIVVKDLKSFEEYKIIFYEKEKGLSLKKNRIIKEFNKKFYAWDDFIGKSFKISEVYFDQFVRGDFLRKKHFFNREYVRFTNKISEHTYLGEVYYTTKYKTCMLDNVNPVEIEICGDVLEDILELSITKEGDGLFLDFEHHGIKNTLDDDSALDIFSYKIKMNGD